MEQRGWEWKTNGNMKNLGEIRSARLCSHMRNQNLRAGVNFSDAFVLDAVVPAQAV